MYSVDFDNGITIDFDKEPTQDQIKQAYEQYQKSQEPQKKTFGAGMANIAKNLFSGKVGQAVENVSSGLVDTAKNLYSRAKGITQDVADTQSVAELPFTAARGARDVVATAGGVIGDVTTTGIKTIYDFVTPEKAKQEGAQALQELTRTKTGQTVSNTIYNFAQNNPTIANEISKTLDIANLALPQLRNPITNVVRSGAETAVNATARGAQAVSEVVEQGGNYVADRLINSLIVPNKNLFAYGKNPGRAVKGIVANSVEELGTKVSAELDNVGQAIGQLGTELSQRGQLRLTQIFGAIDEAIKTAASQNNTTLLNRLKDVKKALVENLVPTVDEFGDIVITSAGKRNLNNMSFSEVRDFLRFIGKQTKYTGNASDDSIINKALQETYSKIKKQSIDFAKKVDPEKAKTFEQLTERYSDLISADIAIANREAILARQSMVGFSPTVTGLGSALISIIVTGGATVPAILAGATAAGLQKLGASALFKTRLAALLATKTPAEFKTIVTQIPWLPGFLGLSSTAGASSLVNQTSKKLRNPLLNNK